MRRAVHGCQVPPGGPYRTWTLTAGAVLAVGLAAYAGKWYQDSDKEYIDYGMYKLFDFKNDKWNWFRGPRVRSDDYIACIGAAQTFGRFCRKPFPILLRERLDVETLNLGLGGVGPTFFYQERKALEAANRSSLVIVQVFSGRSVGCSLFRTIDHDRWGHRSSDSKLMTASAFFSDLHRNEPEKAKRYVRETRENYVKHMAELLSRIKPPKILLWFSKRKPDYKEDYARKQTIFNEFPQLVNREMIERIRKHADAYVECVSSRGLPQIFKDKDGNVVWLKLVPSSRHGTCKNTYYPSPQMHMDAADALEPVCRRLLGLAAGESPPARGRDDKEARGEQERR